jgi:hypothetical protein
MPNEQDLKRLVRELESGAVTRREFVGRAGALGLGLSTIGMILTACGRDKSPGRSGSADLGPI